MYLVRCIYECLTRYNESFLLFARHVDKDKSLIIVMTTGCYIDRHTYNAHWVVYECLTQYNESFLLFARYVDKDKSLILVMTTGCYIDCHTYNAHWVVYECWLGIMRVSCCLTDTLTRTRVGVLTTRSWSRACERSATTCRWSRKARPTLSTRPYWTPWTPTGRSNSSHLYNYRSSRKISKLFVPTVIPFSHVFASRFGLDIFL